MSRSSSDSVVGIIHHRSPNCNLQTFWLFDKALSEKKLMRSHHSYLSSLHHYHRADYPHYHNFYSLLCSWSVPWDRRTLNFTFLRFICRSHTCDYKDWRDDLLVNMMEETLYHYPSWNKSAGRSLFWLLGKIILLYSLYDKTFFYLLSTPLNAISGQTPMTKCHCPKPQFKKFSPKTPTPKHMNQWHFIHWCSVRGIQTGHLKSRMLHAENLPSLRWWVGINF